VESKQMGKVQHMCKIYASILVEILKKFAVVYCHNCHFCLCIRFDVLLMVVKMSVVVFWVMIPYGFVGEHQYFGGTYCLHLQTDMRSIGKWMVYTGLGEGPSQWYCPVRTKEWEGKMNSLD
jgi:hypothetical protein